MLGNNEILYLFEATNCNPNGDSFGRGARVDSLTGTCYVSSSRMKRTVRDYWLGKGYPILIPDYEIHQDEYVDALKAMPGIKENNIDAIREYVLGNFLDARLFGFTNVFSGGHLEIHGPVKLTYASSLFPVQSVMSQGTAAFASKKKKYNRSLRDDDMILFGLFSGYGMVSGKSMALTGATNSDLSNLDEGIVQGINQLHSRTKVGQKTLFYLRIEYGEESGIIDLKHSHLEIQPKKPVDEIRQSEEFEFKYARMIEAIKAASSRIERVYLHDQCTRSDGPAVTELIEESGIEVCPI